MKTLTIGRDPQCDIRYNDERISRHHAVLRIHTYGKMEIVDNSSNGTFVNKVRLSSGTPFPVSRKNVISFAGIQDGRLLDWEEVPDPLKKIKIILVSLLTLVILICGIVFCVNHFGSSNTYDSFVGGGSSSAVADGSADSGVTTVPAGQLELTPGSDAASSEASQEQKETSGNSNTPWFEKTKQEAQRVVQDEKKKKEEAAKAKQETSKKSKAKDEKTTIF